MQNFPASNSHHDTVPTDILLIDDSVTDLRLLMEMMTLRDLHISVALDGTRGYQQAVMLHPRLILLDVRMPNMDGFSVCRRLKNNSLTQNIPVIFLTAANDLSERLEGFAAGGVDYIGKPFEVQEVLARVGVHLVRPVMPAVASEAPSPAVDEVGEQDRRDNELVAAAQELLRDTVADPPGLDRLARLLGTNRRRLNEAFQSLCGQPVYGWLREERYRQAYFQVAQTATPFSIISASLGYSSAANFTKSFRVRFGFTPSEIRAGLLALQSAPQPAVLLPPPLSSRP